MIINITSIEIPFIFKAPNHNKSYVRELYNKKTPLLQPELDAILSSYNQPISYYNTKQLLYIRTMRNINWETLFKADLMFT